MADVQLMGCAVRVGERVGVRRLGLGSEATSLALLLLTFRQSGRLSFSNILSIAPS